MKSQKTVTSHRIRSYLKCKYIIGILLIIGCLFLLKFWCDPNVHSEESSPKSPLLYGFKQIDQNDHQRNDSEFLERLLAKNDHVIIPAGVELRVGGVDVGPGKRVSGPGRLSKIRDAPYALKIVGKNVVIDDLHFQPQKVFGQPNCDIKLGDGAGNIQIRNNYFEGGTGPYSAICAANDIESAEGTEYEHHVKGVLITNNIFNGYVRPLFFHSVDNLTIQGNILRESIRDAIRLRENDGYVIINSNQFFDIGRDDGLDQTQDAIDSCWSGLKLVITDNIVRRTACIGFDIKGKQNYSGQGSSSVIIANNHISETASSGIVLAGSYKKKPIHTVIVEGNILEHNSRIAKNGSAAIWVKGAARYITIANNHVAFNWNRGITVQTRSGKFDGTVTGIQITGNTVLNNGKNNQTYSIGIYILGVDGLILSENMVVNDTFLENPLQKIGVVVAPEKTLHSAIIRDNIIRGHTRQLVLNGVIATDNSNLQIDHVPIP